MEGSFIIDDSQLTRYINAMTGMPLRMSAVNSRWIKKLTNYTHKKMSLYARSRSPRSTGNLVSSIDSDYSLNGTTLSGRVFVSDNVKYQFAQEEGNSRKSVILGRPLMTFSTTAWKNARRASSAGLVMQPHRGYYVFAKVTRGKYRGKHFTQRAFNSLLTYYNSVEGKIYTDLVSAISRG